MPMKKKTRKKTAAASGRSEVKQLGNKEHDRRYEQWKDSASSMRVRSANESHGSSRNTGKNSRSR